MSNNVATTAEDDRVVVLVASGVWYPDDGGVEVTIRSVEEPLTAQTGLRLTEDDALGLASALREAAWYVAGNEPQKFIRVSILQP